jgi:integrase
LHSFAIEQSNKQRILLVPLLVPTKSGQMITVKFIQKPSKQRPDGTVPVWLRITENRRSRFMNTGVSVRPDQWNPERGKVRKNHIASDSLNSRLDTFMVKVLNTLAELERDNRSSADNLSNQLKRNNTLDYLHEYAALLVDQLTASKQYHSVSNYKSSIVKFMEFRKGKPTPMTEIDSEMLNDFVLWMKHVNGNGGNTVKIRITDLRWTLKKAAKEGLIKSVPDVDAIRQVKSKKTKLHPDQIRAIEDLDLEQGSSLWHTRNYFLFSYYYAGIRWGDVCTMKWSNIVDGRLTYVMKKTGNSPAPFRLPEAIRKIVDLYRRLDQQPDDFIFPILAKGRDYSDWDFLERQIKSRNTRVGINLKELVKLAGIEAKVSFHVARHSAAYRMLLEGLDIYTISKALAHENVSITEMYLRDIDDSLLVKALERVFENK